MTTSITKGSGNNPNDKDISSRINRGSSDILPASYVNYSSDIESKITQSSIGLKSLNQIKSTYEQILKNQPLSTNSETTKKSKEIKRKTSKLLSFDMEEDDEMIKCKIIKNPDIETKRIVDTKDFKSTNDVALKAEWLSRVIRIKDEEVSLSYSYLNGNTHAKIHKLKKGNTIGQFLRRIWPDLHSQFLELLESSPEDLIFVKDDLILPHNLSFFDFIVNKCMSKRGLLFNFDFILNDKTGLSSERPDVPVIKVCLITWYQKNKHRFPYDGWQLYRTEDQSGI